MSLLFTKKRLGNNNFNVLVHCVLQKARLTRIRMAKNSAGAAFLNSKKKLEERMAARESGLEVDAELKDNDVFGLQHHHLLTCLEKTTVSLFERKYLISKSRNVSIPVSNMFNALCIKSRRANCKRRPSLVESRESHRCLPPTSTLSKFEICIMVFEKFRRIQYKDLIG